METADFLKIKNIEFLPFNNIVKYTDAAHKNGIPFIGYPKQHPTEKNKLLFVNDPLGINPQVMEFQLEDVLFAAEEPSAVTESGENVPMVKLWVNRGAHGVVLEPFEVDNPIKFIQKNRIFKD